MATFKGSSHSDCAICRANKPFDVPDHLLDELLDGKVTLFVGAGVSTESKRVYKESFLERLAAEIKVEPALGFPEVMSRYCARPNGRLKLLQEIKNRFEHIDSFPEMSQEASRFHRELATFTLIKNIITTNWDQYFERFCMATPFVADPDLVFWEAADRRVLKIHGSVSNFGSIVATNEDYAVCARRLQRGVIGSFLKTILATQTVIFVGYSLRDSDFRAIYNFVRRQMQSLHRQAYVVTPFEADARQFSDDGLVPILTDGTYFIHQIKKHAVAKDLLLEDELYASAGELLWEIEDLHSELYAKVKASKHTEVLYAGAYQDGLMHALARCRAMKASGQYSTVHAIASRLRGYEQWKQKKLKSRIYEDVAYIEGYMNGLFYLVASKKERKDIPRYFAFGKSGQFEYFKSLRQFLQFLHTNPLAHKAAAKRAERCYSNVKDRDSTVIHHPPWL